MQNRLRGKLLAVIVSVLCLAPASAWADDTPVTIDEANFPDEYFRQIVCEYDTDGNDELSPEEIAAVTEIDCSYGYAESLKGIEYFTSLKELNCIYNSLTSLDLSQNTALETLECGGNQLGSLDLSRNTALESLECEDAQLNSLDVSKCSLLKKLYCYDNKLTSLDLAQSAALAELWCDNNQLSSLDLSRNLALEWLSCSGNSLKDLDLSLLEKLESVYCEEAQLTSLSLGENTALNCLNCSSNNLSSLDVSGLASLEELECGYNELTSLDVSKNSALKKLYCHNNKLTSLDLRQNVALEELECESNQLTSLDVSNNTALWRVVCHDNAYVIGVDGNRQFDMSVMPGGFKAEKASGWEGGSVSGTILTVDDDATSVTYTYSYGGGRIASFTLEVGYAVVFDTGEGSGIDAQTVKIGECASRPEDPTWAGHAFAGWYADAACTREFDFGAPVEAPTTVYAKFEPLPSYAVVFETGGGSAVAAQAVQAGECASRPEDPTWAGHAFAGWYADAACTREFDFGAPVEAPTTVYAKWIVEENTPSVVPGSKDDETPAEENVVDGSAPKANNPDSQNGKVSVKENVGTGSAQKANASGGNLPNTGDGNGALVLAALAACAASLASLAIRVRRRMNSSVSKSTMR